MLAGAAGLPTRVSRRVRFKVAIVFEYDLYVGVRLHLRVAVAVAAAPAAIAARAAREGSAGGGARASYWFTAHEKYSQ